MEYISYDIGRPKHSIREAVERGVTYSAPLNATMRLVTRDPETLVMKMAVDQGTFLGELPQMTKSGSFIINGAERVIVSQLHRSPGVFFEEKIQQRGRKICTTRIIPQKGSWKSERSPEPSLSTASILTITISCAISMHFFPEYTFLRCPVTTMQWLI